MSDFVFRTVPDIRVLRGGAEALADPVRRLCESVKRPLIVTDEGIVSAGLLERALAGLDGGGLRPAVYDGVLADPPSWVVEAACDTAKRSRADCVIGFGGGSAMDVAKLVAVLAGGDRSLDRIYGLDRIGTRRTLPLIQIPTTAGTGSEVTPIAIVTTGRTSKMGVVDPALYADLVILDATLTLGLPAPVTAATGIDAMVHATEAYTSRRLKNPLSDQCARSALALLARHGLRAVQQGDNIDAREGMLIGAMLAGQAFANAPVGGVHALAYPLGGRYHLPHGLTNALVLPHVLAFNREAAGPLYSELAPILLPDVRGNEHVLAEAFGAALEDLCVQMGLPRRLRDVDVPEEDIAALATDAMKQTRLLVNNPRDMTENDARRIYEAAW